MVKKTTSTYNHGSKSRVLEKLLDFGMSVAGCLICRSLLQLVLNYIDVNGDRDQKQREKKLWCNQVLSEMVCNMARAEHLFFLYCTCRGQ